MKKIGIIDSGIGGLSLLSQLIGQSLDAEYFYISDTHNVPYGEKPQSFLLEKMIEMSEKLILKKVDAIFIACNTATVSTIDQLRQQFQIPYIGIEPYINYLNHKSSPGKLAIMLTPATANSSRFKNLVEKFDPNGEVYIYTPAQLALIIEKLQSKSFDQLKHQIDSELAQLKDRNFEKLILGCTHYPIIKNYIEEELGLKTIDPAEQVINHLKKTLELENSNKINQEFWANFDNSTSWHKYKIDDFNFLKP